MLGKLYGIGRQAGMTDEQMNACMQDRALAEALVAEYQKNSEADGMDCDADLPDQRGEGRATCPTRSSRRSSNAALGA